MALALWYHFISTLTQALKTPCYWQQSANWLNISNIWSWLHINWQLEEHDHEIRMDSFGNHLATLPLALTFCEANWDPEVNYWCMKPKMCTTLCCSHITFPESESHCSPFMFCTSSSFFLSNLKDSTEHTISLPLCKLTFDFFTCWINWNKEKLHFLLCVLQYFVHLQGAAAGDR